MIPDAIATNCEDTRNQVQANPKNSKTRSPLDEYRKNRVEIDTGPTSRGFVSTTVSATVLSCFLGSISSSSLFDILKIE